MKKLWLLPLVFVSIFIELKAWAACPAGITTGTCYYVRTDGGTATQCAGTTDAGYPGTGTNQPCAFNHLSWALGASGNATAKMVAGDALIIDEVDEAVGSGQAQYKIGVGMPNDSGPNCDPNNFPYGCGLNSIPAGVDAAHTTKIYGKQWNSGTCGVVGPAHKPQLWGTQSVGGIFAVKNNVDVQCLEITDHSACMFRGPRSAFLVDGDPLLCPETYPTTVQYARGAISSAASVSNLNFASLYIHGAGQYGIALGDNNTAGTIGNVTLTDVTILGESLVGFQTDPAAVIDPSSTVTWIRPNVEWSGCGEYYPLVSSIVDDPKNFHDCYEQNQGGYGDGIAFGNAASGTPGNWVFKGPGSVSHNTQDGIDTLHGDGSGSIKVDKIKMEGNAGQQIKPVGSDIQVTNSPIIANCSYFQGQPFTSTTSTGFSSGSCSGTWNSTQQVCYLPFQGSCRANGSAVLVRLKTGVVAQYYNDTFNSGGSNIMIELNGQGSTCDSTTKVFSKNNVFVGGWSWLDDTYHNGAGGNSLSTFTFNDGGSTGGTCDSIGLTEDYDVVGTGFKNNASNCSGAHSQCNVALNLAGPIANGHGSRTSYFYQSDYLSSNYLTLSSPAKGGGVAGLTYWNTSNDFNNAAQNSPVDSGALIYNSPSQCTFNSSACSTNADCCSLNCSASTCSEPTNCSNGNQACWNSPSTSCCGASACTSSICAASCSSIGVTCTQNSDCCSSYCSPSLTCQNVPTQTGARFFSGQCRFSGRSVL